MLREDLEKDLVQIYGICNASSLGDSDSDDGVAYRLIGTRMIYCQLDLEIKRCVGFDCQYFVRPVTRKMTSFFVPGGDPSEKS